MTDFGLTTDPVANERQYRHWKLGECVAYMFPDASLDGLELAACLFGWYFAPFDDQFDGEFGRDPRRATELCQHLCDVTGLPSDAAPPSREPVTVAFADLWRRSCEGMSESWRRRAAHNWRQYFSGQLAEVVNRLHDRIPSVDECLRARAATISVRPPLDLIERTSGYEVPDLAWHLPLLRRLTDLVVDITVLTNDLVSADKEAAAGDIANNVLLLLEHQAGLSRDQAIERMRAMSHQRQELFLELEQQVPDLDDVLTTSERLAVRRYVANMHDFCAGDNEWEHTTGRYA